MIMTWFSTSTGLVLALLEDLDQALTAGQLGLGRGVEVGAELGEGLQLAVLREVEAEPPAIFFMALICAEPPTRETEIPDVHRRADALS